MNETTASLRPSATILMLRDDPDLQVLMVKRHQEVEFAAGAMVFPGGKTMSNDRADGWSTRTDGEFSGDALEARVGAIREAFEESGLLLARHASDRGKDAPLVGPDTATQMAPMRGAVDRGEVDFLTVIEEHDLVLALDRLVHFGHWITPEFVPKRFDTHFFIAATPPGQVAEQDGRETTEAVWTTPQAALEAERDGTATIFFPTRMNLDRLSLAQSTKDALQRFASMQVPTVLPEMTRDASGVPCLSIPEIEGYSQVLEPIEKMKNVAGRQRPPAD